ncbi:hypothetical protein [Novosphingobium lentum]|uniref:hypothetical protein n=1 Tax=Novosphingobium lentum TaxID=145287 RepID=UPI001FE22BB2|nr:hypothetical protein [Novosphingobium lentum]
MTSERGAPAVTADGWARNDWAGADPALDTARMVDPQPLLESGRSLARLAGPLVSIAFLLAVAWQLRDLNFASLFAMMPRHPLFWLVFAASYLAGPISEWVIFRKLWNLPVEGFAALLRKMVSNELLLGYLGEVYFYAWAKRNTHIAAAPFGAVKDVAILSAMVGNVFTLLLVVVSAPLFGSLNLGVNSGAFVWSAIFVLASSLVVTVFRNKLFSLPRNELWFVTGLHALRIVAATLLAAVMWHLLLPVVALQTWLLLSTLRQLLWRLPFLPNKDVAFAGLAAVLVGANTPIVEAIALVASLILGTHLLVGASLGISGLLAERSRS